MLRYLSMSLLLLYFFSFAHASEKEAFYSFDLNKYEQIYTDLLKLDEASSQEAYLDSLYGLSKGDKVNLLAYIGLYQQDYFSFKNYFKTKKIAIAILNDPVASLDGFYHSEHREIIARLSPHIQKMLRDHRYNIGLIDLYHDISGRYPPSFWQNNHVFQTMLAFGRKKNNLYIKELDYDGNYKVNPAFEKVQNLLNEDMAKISQILLVQIPEIRFVYAPSRKAAAWYHIEKQNIFINIAYPNLTWHNLTEVVLWHEFYHALQYQMIERYIYEDVEQTKDRFIHQKKQRKQIWLAAIYNANLIGYRPNELNYTIYRQQPIEKSAWDFGQMVEEHIVNKP